MALPDDNWGLVVVAVVACARRSRGDELAVGAGVGIRPGARTDLLSGMPVTVVLEVASTVVAAAARGGLKPGTEVDDGCGRLGWRRLDRIGRRCEGTGNRLVLGVGRRDWSIRVPPLAPL